MGKVSTSGRCKRFEKLRKRRRRLGQTMKKRNLFAEIAEGFDALANERTGKQTLRTHKVEVQPLAEVTAEELVTLRERLHLSGLP